MARFGSARTVQSRGTTFWDGESSDNAGALVQLVEIENSLPNGFHDAFLESLTVDYASRRSSIRLRLWVGDPDAVVKDKREAYKGADLELLNIVYFVIEAPDPGSEYEAVKSLWIDGGEASLNISREMREKIKKK